VAKPAKCPGKRQLARLVLRPGRIKVYF